MKKFIYLFAVASLFLLGSCKENVNEEKLQKLSPTALQSLTQHEYDTVAIPKGLLLEAEDNGVIVPVIMEDKKTIYLTSEHPDNEDEKFILLAVLCIFLGVFIGLGIASQSA